MASAESVEQYAVLDRHKQGLLPAPHRADFVLSWCVIACGGRVRCYRRCVAYPLAAAQLRLAALVAEALQSRRPVTISEDGKPVVALIGIDDLADLEDRAALAAHLADKAAGRGGVSLDELDAALDRIDAETSA